MADLMGKGEGGDLRGDRGVVVDESDNAGVQGLPHSVVILLVLLPLLTNAT